LADTAPGLTSQYKATVYLFNPDVIVRHERLDALVGIVPNLRRDGLPREDMRPLYDLRERVALLTESQRIGNLGKLYFQEIDDLLKRLDTENALGIDRIDAVDPSF